MYDVQVVKIKRIDYQTLLMKIIISVSLNNKFYVFTRNNVNTNGCVNA